MTDDEYTNQKSDAEADERQEGDFSFINETVKEGKSGKKAFKGAIAIFVIGIALGMLIRPAFKTLKTFLPGPHEEKEPGMTFPEDEGPPKKDTQKDGEKDGKETESGRETEIPGLVPAKSGADSFREMMGSIYETVKESGKSIVYIRPAAPEWEDFGYGHNSAAGILVADNRSEIFILCGSDVLCGADSFTARFPDNRDYEVTLKKQDAYTGLAVFSMPKESLATFSAEVMKVAALGNSNLVTRSDLVFALGNLSGYDDGVGYGVISTKLHQEMLADRHYNILYTDMASDAEGSGFLFNLSGEAVGFIHPALRENSSHGATKAIAISDLKKIIELLVNGESVPYAGVYGVTVTEAVSAGKDMPQGVYVSSVETDSPAMAAGIQSGDILQEVAGTKIMNAPAYEKAILERKAGENIAIRGKRLGASGYVDIKFEMTVGGGE